jgi:hypothetical protein
MYFVDLDESIYGMGTFSSGHPAYGDRLEILGMFDIAQAQNNMDDLKPVTVEIAKLLLRGGQEAIDGAIKGAKQPWYKPDLPGDKRRDNVMWKLRWHADTLGRLAGSMPHTTYVSGDDLKKWVMAAYIEANAVEEGAAYVEQSWNRMWTEIRDQLAKIPKAVREAAANAVYTITGVPVWGWVVGAIGVVGILGWAIYKLANTRAGGAVAGVAVRRYLR